MRMLLASLLFATACSSAYADQVAAPVAPGPRTALAIAPAKVRAPYDVQIVREDGETLPTYAFRDRFYVQGVMNERYTIRVTNPTPNRVEAVVSVDGLDVIDGDTANLAKRGYIVPPYGDVHIEGFRTSLEDVASFRFSSVDGSYAGRQGKARNVGVIAVAIFEETAPPPEQIIVTDGRRYDYRDDIVAHRPYGGGHGYRGAPGRAEKKAAPSAPADAPAPPPATATTAPRNEAFDDGDYGGGGEMQGAPAPRTNRLGLGTEFGESRYSAASYTRFVRSAGRPVAIAELRYNDSAGLMALGIPVQPMPDEGELMTRETADPFPGDVHFSRQP